MIGPIFESKIRKGEDNMSPLPHQEGRKVEGVQMKEEVFNLVLTKYKRLGPFSNPKSEKGGWRHAPEKQFQS